MPAPHAGLRIPGTTPLPCKNACLPHLSSSCGYLTAVLRGKVATLKALRSLISVISLAAIAVGGLVVAHTLSIAQAAGTANDIELSKLALSTPQAAVFRVTRIRFDDADRPLAHEEVVLPSNRLSGLAANGGDIPEITELAQRHSLTLGRATERVTITPAAPHVARHLRIAPGTEVVKLDRVTETADGKPIEWRVVFCVRSIGSPPLKPSADQA
jgi:hypothetical protein